MNTKKILKDIDLPRLRRTSLNIYPTDYCNRRCLFCKLTGVLTAQENRADMTMQDIDTIIDFCKRSGVNQLRILGGEPAHHPQIVDLIERIYERGMFVGIIFTNGIFDNDELIKCVLRHHIAINMNCFPKDEYENGQLELVQENMSRLFLEVVDSKGVVGQKLIKSNNGALSVTFYKPGQPYQYIIDTCLKYKVDSIRWAVSHSSITQENKHVYWDLFRRMIPLILNFVRDAAKAGISNYLECVLVPCMFSTREYSLLSRFVNNFKFTCEPILDVFPDLSVHYCMGMPIVSWITKKNTLNQIFLEQAVISEYFRRRLRNKSCLKCEWRQKKLCQGYCLQYKYDKDNPQDRKLLAGLEWIERRKNENKSTACS